MTTRHILLALTLSTTALADQPARPRRGPPPEAIAACKDRSPGDACTVAFPDHTIDGTCRNGPDGKGVLACAPDHPPPPAPPDEPPPER